jgi:hypothetical protein
MEYDVEACGRELVDETLTDAYSDSDQLVSHS